MRFFEVILIVANFFYILPIRKFSQVYIKYIFIAVNLSLFAAHTFFEGIRYQMIFSYLLILVLIIQTIFMTLKSNSHKPFSRAIIVLVKTITIILIITTIALSNFFPVFNLPKPTGNYNVGQITFHLTDLTRDETFTQSKDSKRELMVKVYYPSDNISNTKYGKYLEYPSISAPLLASHMGYPSFIFNHLSLVKTNSYLNASISNKKSSFPLIVFSHGLGLSKELYTSALEDLASHGYIVAAVDHTYFTFGTVFSDKHVTGNAIANKYKSNSEMMKYSALWSQDLQFIIDKFEQLNQGIEDSIFDKKIDTTNIGVLGHSFGGAAAYNLCFTDKRVKCGINLDGSTFYIPSDNRNLKIPFMMIARSDSAQYIKEKQPITFFKDLPPQAKQKYTELSVSEEAYNTDVLLEQKLNESLKNNLTKSGTLISIKGIKHNSFTDYGFMLPLENKFVKGMISQNKASKIINTCTLAFFDKYLKGVPSAMLEKRESPFKEMFFVDLSN